MINGAILSEDRRYRYRLWRAWGDGNRRVAFVGLNPSTADENVDDATIRKCVGFAKRWGFGAIDMINLFAWRSRDPRGLLDVEDPVGPDNDAAIKYVVAIAQRVVWCWGQHPSKVAGLVTLRCMRTAFGPGDIPNGTEVGILGQRLASGAPRHPLMLAYSTPFMPTFGPRTALSESVVDGLTEGA
jgi:hypothetical protein